MSKLILFSGGVESTALLSVSSKNDIALVIEPWESNRYVPNKNKVNKFCEYYNLIQKRVVIPNDVFVNSGQIEVLREVILAVTLEIKNISEVWIGMNSHDLTLDNITQHNEMYRIIAEERPLIILDSPLKHETKSQQWNRIPFVLREYVHSCFHEKPCGICNKCIELSQAINP